MNSALERHGDDSVPPARNGFRIGDRSAGRHARARSSPNPHCHPDTETAESLAAAQPEGS